MKKILKAIWNYLKDWKNLLAHSLVGVLILVVAIYLPVTLGYRIAVLVLIVALNILRMRWAKKRNKKTGV